MVPQTDVVEIVTFTLKEGVSVADFVPVDKAVEDQHVRRQPGFVSREVAASGRDWLVIVRWATAAAAQASMDSFATAPAAARFLDMLDLSTMRMTRYDRLR